MNPKPCRLHARYVSMCLVHVPQHSAGISTYSYSAYCCECRFLACACTPHHNRAGNQAKRPAARWRATSEAEVMKGQPLPASQQAPTASITKDSTYVFMHAFCVQSCCKSCVKTTGTHPVALRNPCCHDHCVYTIMLTSCQSIH